MFYFSNVSIQCKFACWGRTIFMLVSLSIPPPHPQHISSTGISLLHPLTKHSNPTPDWISSICGMHRIFSRELFYNLMQAMMPSQPWKSRCVCVCVCGGGGGGGGISFSTSKRKVEPVSQTRTQPLWQASEQKAKKQQKIWIQREGVWSP